MKIDNYILERLRADAAHTIAVAECENAIQHPGLRGRLREILIANLLAPWLPPFCKCATGMIIESSNKPRRLTQEDILVIDPTLAPPILANADGPEGVFLFNSVLLRIEVKSTINAKGLSDFIEASAEIANMQFDKQPDCKTKFIKPYSVLVAFKSDSSSDEWDFEFNRFCAATKNKNCPPLLSGFILEACRKVNSISYPISAIAGHLGGEHRLPMIEREPLQYPFLLPSDMETGSCLGV